MRNVVLDSHSVICFSSSVIEPICPAVGPLPDEKASRQTAAFLSITGRQEDGHHPLSPSEDAVDVTINQETFELAGSRRSTTQRQAAADRAGNERPGRRPSHAARPSGVAPSPDKSRGKGRASTARRRSARCSALPELPEASAAGEAVTDAWGGRRHI